MNPKIDLIEEMYGLAAVVATMDNMSLDGHGQDVRRDAQDRLVELVEAVLNFEEPNDG